MVPALEFRLAYEWDNWSLYQLGRELALSVEYLLQYFDHEPNLEKVRLLYQNLPMHSLKDMALKGNDLMAHFDYPRGAWISSALHALEKEVVEGRLKNNSESLLDFAKIFLEKEMA